MSGPRPDDGDDRLPGGEPEAAGEPPAGPGLDLEAEAPTGRGLPPDALLEPDFGADRAFAEDLDEDARTYGEARPSRPVCPWCDHELDAPSERCPHCGAPLTPVAEGLAVPGLTDLSPEAHALLDRQQAPRPRRSAGWLAPRPRLPPAQPMVVTDPAVAAALAAPVPPLGGDEAAAAARPPDDEVRRLMREMELEAEERRRHEDEAAFEPLPEPAATAGTEAPPTPGGSGPDESGSAGSAAESASASDPGVPGPS